VSPRIFISIINLLLGLDLGIWFKTFYCLRIAKILGLKPVRYQCKGPPMPFEAAILPMVARTDNANTEMPALTPL
jgi:hypothetical protein